MLSFDCLCIGLWFCNMKEERGREQYTYNRGRLPTTKTHPDSILAPTNRPHHMTVFGRAKNARLHKLNGAMDKAEVDDKNTRTRVISYGDRAQMSTYRSSIRPARQGCTGLPLSRAGPKAMESAVSRSRGPGGYDMRSLKMDRLKDHFQDDKARSSRPTINSQEGPLSRGSS